MWSSLLLVLSLLLEGGRPQPNDFSSDVFFPFPNHFVQQWEAQHYSCDTEVVLDAVACSSSLYYFGQKTPLLVSSFEWWTVIYFGGSGKSIVIRSWTNIS
jgi:hypothetical protein